MVMEIFEYPNISWTIFGWVLFHRNSVAKVCLRS